MDDRCRLGSLGNLYTSSGCSYPGGTVDPSYSYFFFLTTIAYFARILFFAIAVFLSIFTLFYFLLHLFLLYYFIFAVPSLKCCGQHSSMSSIFSLATLNGTSSFRSAKTVKKFWTRSAVELNSELTNGRPIYRQL